MALKKADNLTKRLITQLLLMQIYYHSYLIIYDFSSLEEYFLFSHSLSHDSIIRAQQKLLHE